MKYPDKQQPPLQVNSDPTTEAGSPQHFPSFRAVPLKRGRIAPPPNEELEEEMFSEVAQGCFRNQEVTQEHLSPSWGVSTEALGH